MHVLGRPIAVLSCLILCTLMYLWNYILYRLHILSQTTALTSCIYVHILIEYIHHMLLAKPEMSVWVGCSKEWKKLWSIWQSFHFCQFLCSDHYVRNYEIFNQSSQWNSLLSPILSKSWCPTDHPKLWNNYSIGLNGAKYWRILPV